jgi:hypothetical protein
MIKVASSQKQKSTDDSLENKSSEEICLGLEQLVGVICLIFAERGKGH